MDNEINQQPIMHVPSKYHKFVRFAGPISFELIVLIIVMFIYPPHFYSAHADNTFHNILFILVPLAFLLGLMSLIKFSSNPFKAAKLLGLTAFIISILASIGFFLLIFSAIANYN